MRNILLIILLLSIVLFPNESSVISNGTEALEGVRNVNDHHFGYFVENLGQWESDVKFIGTIDQNKFVAVKQDRLDI
ncbi:MAG: hypothetical protein U9R75_10245, partial [Candidatus Thermoplasmatota archaeon]|nr:hypothetical protein [Candidatus Thermoplasmatota archaeon]